MRTSLFITTSFATVLLAIPSFAQSPTTSPGAASLPSDSPKSATTTTTSSAPAAGQMTKADMEKMMAQMMELSKPGENHKLLADMAGTWDFTVKMWMDPSSAKPDESKGTATRKEMFGGRFFIMDVTGKMDMPGPDGKKKSMDFKGMSIEGYDNIKKKFVSSWIDNMGTMIMASEGTYDPATKSFTYNAECEMMPGMHTKIREVIKVVDKDHHTFEWYEDRGGKEAKTMEIAYTRKK